MTNLNTLEGYILPFIAILLTASAAIYCIFSVTNLTNLKEYRDNEDLKTADVFLSTSQVVLWIIAITFFILILMHLYGENMMEKWTHLLPAILVISLLFVVIIFIAIAIDYINKSNVLSNINNKNNRSKKDSIVALILVIAATIVSFSLVMLRGTDDLYGNISNY